MCYREVGMEDEDFPWWAPLIPVLVLVAILILAAPDGYFG